jgi:hypothetical protein
MPKLQRRSLQQLQTLLHLRCNGLLLLQRLKLVKSLFWHGGNADLHRFKADLSTIPANPSKKVICQNKRCFWGRDFFGLQIENLNK